MQNNQTGSLDILDFLSHKKSKQILGRGFNSIIYRKFLILKEFLTGNADIKRTFWSLVPESKRSSTFKEEDDLDIQLLYKYFSYHFEEPVNLLGYKWYYDSLSKIGNKKDSYSCFIAFLALVEDIIIKDQYDAKEFLHSDDSKVILDCGANIGIFSLWAHYLSSESQIYSFEPTKSTFEILEKNIKINNLDKNILAFNMALGDTQKQTVIRINKEGGSGAGNSLIDSKFITSATILQEVLMVTLDNFVQENNLPRVDFIKIDTEGYEKQIIQGASETIKRFSPVIACSAYHFKNDKIEIPKLVKSINPNYHYKLLKRSEEDLIFWVNKTS